MRYALFDYHPDVSAQRDAAMQGWWGAHWTGRELVQRDLTSEPLWPTIADVLETPGLVLEAGCGYGQWVQFLGRRGHRVVGIDYAHSGLRSARKADPALRLMRADFRRLPFRDDMFDYIISLGAIEHDEEGPEAALAEFRRTLKPGGRLMCSVPCLNVERRLLLPWFVVRDSLKKRAVLRRLAGKPQRFEFYEYLFTPGEYSRILSTRGLELESLRTYGVSSRSRIARRAGERLGRVLPYYNPHMMMAICRKLPAASGAHANDAA